MWLPRAERQLLMLYTVSDPDLNGNAMLFSVKQLGETATKRLRARQIAKCAAQVRGANDQTSQGTNCRPKNSGGSEHMKWLSTKGVIESANNRLQKRDLIETRECGTGLYEVTLKLAGWDLGCNYNSWWDRTGLWFREYKDHWVWLIVSFIGGVLGALVVQWLLN